tara:strand:+ start:262 stop:645 length:384 start_codon:yes stop_codon:yes gene_type:complete
MANPNIVGVTSIYGKTAAATNIATTGTDIVTCAANKILKINSLVVTNVDSNDSGPTDISVAVIGDGTNMANASHYLARNIVVPDSTSLVLISKDTSIYLLEGDKLQLTSNVNSDLAGFVSYEEIDDA